MVPGNCWRRRPMRRSKGLDNRSTIKHRIGSGCGLAKVSLFTSSAACSLCVDQMLITRIVEPQKGCHFQSSLWREWCWSHPWKKIQGERFIAPLAWSHWSTCSLRTWHYRIWLHTKYYHPFSFTLQLDCSCKSVEFSLYFVRKQESSTSYNRAHFCTMGFTNSTGFSNDP